MNMEMKEGWLSRASGGETQEVTAESEWTSPDEDVSY